MHFKKYLLATVLTIGLQPGLFNVTEDVGGVSICVAAIGENIADFRVPFTIITKDTSATSK